MQFLQAVYSLIARLMRADVARLDRALVPAGRCAPSLTNVRPPARSRWTTIPFLLVAALLVGLLVASPAKINAQTTTVGFDTLADGAPPTLALTPTASFALIPDGYAGLNWDNFYYINKNYLPGTGYQAGTVSGTNAAFNGNGDVATIVVPLASSFGFFNFDSAELTAAFIPGLTVTVDGYNTKVSSSPIFSQMVTLSNTSPTLFNFDSMGDFTGINQLTFTSDPNSADTAAGAEFAMDNFTFTPTDTGSGVPEPGSLALAAFGFGGLLVVARRRAARSSRACSR